MNEKKYFKTIDGETLMDMPIAPIEFVVSEILPQGLHILSGAPKAGKSWLVLWLCLQVAKGEKVWNFDTKQGTALYLCLEDSYTRIQSRLFDIADDAPSTVRFATVSENIGNGIEEQIENFVCEYPNTKLIVIDTLQKIRSASNDNAYASDYREIGMLKSIADKFSIAILLIHHLRKQKDDDPMNMVSGTTGITGAVDSSFVLVKDKRSSEKATLYCDGRDIEYRELQLQFNKEIHLWEILSDSVENPIRLFDKTIEFVLEFAKENNCFYGTPTELAEALQIYADEKIIPNSLSKKLLQNQLELKKAGIDFTMKRSNGKRYVELKMSADSDGSDG